MGDNRPTVPLPLTGRALMGPCGAKSTPGELHECCATGDQVACSVGYRRKIFQRYLRESLLPDADETARRVASRTLIGRALYAHEGGRSV